MFGLFVTSTRSPIFKTAFDTASKAINETMPLRRQAGIKGPLLVECYDSLNMFTGYGVQVMEALRQFDAEPSVANIRDNMQKSSKNAYCYIAPSNLDFILTRAKAKGEKSVGALGAAAAKILGLLPIISCNQGVTSSVAKVRGAAVARSCGGSSPPGRATAIGVVESSMSSPPHGGRWLALPTAKYRPIMFCAMGIRA